MSKKAKYYVMFIIVSIVAIIALAIWWYYPSVVVHRLVMEACDGPSIDDYFYSGRSSEAIHDDMRSLGGRAVGPLVRHLKNPNSHVRQIAARFLGDIKDPSAIPALMGAAQDPDELVRSSAVHALVEIGPPANATNLLITCMSDRRGATRAFAAKGLGEINDSNALGALFYALTDGDPLVRSHVVHSLGKFEDARIQPTLRKCLEYDPDEDVAFEAGMVLLAIGDNYGIAKIITMIENDTQDKWRINVMNELGNIGNPLARELLERFRVTVKSEDVRNAAARAIEKINAVERTKK